MGGRVPRFCLVLVRRDMRLLRSSDKAARREPDAGCRRGSSAPWEVANEPWRRRRWLRVRRRSESLLLLLSLLPLLSLLLLVLLLSLSLLDLLELVSPSPVNVEVVPRRRWPLLVLDDGSPDEVVGVVEEGLVLKR